METSGSLLLLIPSLAIAIGGFAVAINIAMNSPDAVSQVTSEIEENIAASFKPKPAIYESDGECRGLCSNQDKDIDNLRSFLNRISGADAGTASDDVYVPESENSTPAVSENDVKEEVVEPVENSNLSTDSAPKEEKGNEEDSTSNVVQGSDQLSASVFSLLFVPNQPTKYSKEDAQALRSLMNDISLGSASKDYASMSKSNEYKPPALKDEVRKSQETSKVEAVKTEKVASTSTSEKPKSSSSGTQKPTKYSKEDGQALRSLMNDVSLDGVSNDYESMLKSNEYIPPNLKDEIRTSSVETGKTEKVASTVTSDKPKSSGSGTQKNEEKYIAPVIKDTKVVTEVKTVPQYTDTVVKVEEKKVAPVVINDNPPSVAKIEKPKMDYDKLNDDIEVPDQLSSDGSVTTQQKDDVDSLRSYVSKVSGTDDGSIKVESSDKDKTEIKGKKSSPKKKVVIPREVEVEKTTDGKVPARDTGSLRYFVTKVSDEKLKTFK